MNRGFLCFSTENASTPPPETFRPGSSIIRTVPSTLSLDPLVGAGIKTRSPALTLVTYRSRPNRASSSRFNATSVAFAFPATFKFNLARICISPGSSVTSGKIPPITATPLRASYLCVIWPSEFTFNIRNVFGSIAIATSKLFTLMACESVFTISIGT